MAKASGTGNGPKISNRTGMTKAEEDWLTAAVRAVIGDKLADGSRPDVGAFGLKVRDGAYITFSSAEKAAYWLGGMTGEYHGYVAARKISGAVEGVNWEGRTAKCDACRMSDVNAAIALYGHPAHAAEVLRRQVAEIGGDCSAVIAELDQKAIDWTGADAGIAESGAAGLAEAEAAGILGRQLVAVVPAIMRAMVQWIEDNALLAVRTHDGSTYYAREGDIHAAKQVSRAWGRRYVESKPVALHDAAGNPATYRGRTALALSSLEIVDRINPYSAAWWEIQTAGLEAA